MEMADVLQKFQSIENPTNQDLLTLMLSLLKTCSNINARVSRIEETVSQVEINTVRIERAMDRLVKMGISPTELVENFAHENPIVKNSFLKQKDIDQDVIITGFVDDPDEEAIASKLCEKFNFPRDKIFTTESWSFINDDTKKKKGVMIITFKSKTAQIQFMKKKIEFGNLVLNELLDHDAKEDFILLRINNRLSQLNLDILKKLRDLLKSGEIAHFRYRNWLFYIRKEAHSALIPITSLEMLDKLFEVEKPRKHQIISLK
jgi:hypothetical protein